jgi:hypothetical protein
MSGRYNIVVDQGTTFSLVFNILTDEVPWNLVGNYTARMQVRNFINSEDVLVELTTQNNRITFAAGGQVTLSLSAAITEDLPVGRHRYDLEFIASNGTVQRILEGRFVVRAEVTR